MNIFEYLHARAVRNANLDLLIGRSQREFTRSTIIIVGGVLWALFFGPKLDPLMEKLLIFVLGGLLGGWASQNQFWYGRPRGGGVPDPTNTETTTKETKTIEVETKTTPTITAPEEVTPPRKPNP